MTTQKKIIIDQGIGSFVEKLNMERLSILQESLSKILSKENFNLSLQDKNFLKAVSCVDAVRDFVSTPEHILGSAATKHGEIAEQVQVNIENAKKFINGFEAEYTFEGVGRTAPEDYLTIMGEKVQSKFYNGAQNTLKAVIEHNEKYNDFTQNGFYEIPKDQYKVIKQVLNNEKVDGLSEKSIQKIRNYIKDIERKTHKPFEEVVRSGNSNYRDVQLRKINETLDKEEQRLAEIDKENRKIINEKSDSEKREAYSAAAPTWQEAAKVTGTAAAVGAGLSLTFGIYKKYKEGKTINKFTSEDWKELGIETGKGALKSGVTGLSIYGVTNFTSTTAPMASAYVSTVFGIASLAQRYKNGEISQSEFVTDSQVIAMESGMAALGATLGQIVIPIPILGAVIGTVATTFVNSIVKNYLVGKEKVLLEKYNRRFKEEYMKVEAEYLGEFNKILKKYIEIGNLIDGAFDYEINAKLRFEKSGELAVKLGVKKEEILKTKQDIDDYFLN